MNKLTIFWHEKSADSFYWVCTKSNEASAIPNLESHEILKADLACLAEMAKQSKVELIVSSNDIHIGEVAIPGKAQRHLRKAVPYLLEEQVAESVDDIFIALGERNAKDKIPVRAIAQPYLEQLIESFKHAEIKLDKISVDLDRIPVTESDVTVVLMSDEVLAVDDKHETWRCELEDFSWIVQKHLEANKGDEGDDEILPVAIPLTIISEDDERARLFENNLPAGRFAPEINSVDNVLEYLSEQQVETINLLQAEYEPKAESSELKQLLYKVAIVAVVVLSTHILYQGSQWFTLAAKAEQLEQQKEILWKQAFPGRKMPKAANRQIQSKLRSLGGSNSDNAFLEMFAQVTEKITNLEQLYPTNVSFDAIRSEMRLDLIGKEYATLNQYRDALIASGFEVEMNSATQRGDGYSTRFIVKKKG